MGNHPGRSGRFEVSINCAGMGADWREDVAAALEGVAQTVRHLPAQVDGSLHSTAGAVIGRWSYRPPREPAPPSGRAAP